MKSIACIILAGLSFITVSTYSQNPMDMFETDYVRYQTDTKGIEYDLKQMILDSNAILLDFYADWCGPCRVSKPALENTWQQFRKGKNGVYIFGINVDGETNERINSDTTSSYPRIGGEAGKKMSAFFGITAIPTFIIISPAESPDSAKLWLVQGIPLPIENTEAIIIEWFTSMGYKTSDEMSTGIASAERKKSNLQIYPNPVTDIATLKIDSDNAYTVKRLIIYSSAGLTLKEINPNPSGTFENRVIQFPVHDLPQGLYYLQVISDTSTQTNAFIVQ